MTQAEARLLEAIRGVVRDELEARDRDALPPRGGSPARLVTVADYAAARSISKSTVRAAIRDGRLPATKIGSAVRVAADVEIGTRIATIVEGRTARAAKLLGIKGGRT